MEAGCGLRNKNHIIFGNIYFLTCNIPKQYFHVMSPYFFEKYLLIYSLYHYFCSYFLLYYFTKMYIFYNCFIFT
uniref:Uncharacterized protein n=1 Tax=Octopus bimaculoides TaxID=37653 RepID=A0A0L8G2H1_OCTBM